MITPPNIDHKTITIHLLDNYGLSITSIHFLPIGEASFNYRIDTSERSYLFKLSKSFSLSHHQKIATFLSHLMHAGVPGLSIPIPTRGGEFIINFENYSSSLIAFIDGQHPSSSIYSSRALNQISTTLAQVHRSLDEAKLLSLPQEKFDLEFLPHYNQNLETLNSLNDPTEYQAKLKVLLHAKQPELSSNLARLQELQSGIKHQNLIWTVAHTDIHSANILIDNSDKLFLLDWEGIKIAPQEQDLRIFQNQFDEFIINYQKFMPQIQIQPNLLRFYSYRRFFDDLTDWLTRIVSGTNGPEQDRNDFQGIIDDCFASYQDIENEIDNKLKNVPKKFLV